MWSYFFNKSKDNNDDKYLKMSEEEIIQPVLNAFNKLQDKNNKLIKEVNSASSEIAKNKKEVLSGLVNDLTKIIQAYQNEENKDIPNAHKFLTDLFRKCLCTLETHDNEGLKTLNAPRNNNKKYLDKSIEYGMFIGGGIASAPNLYTVTLNFIIAKTLGNSIRKLLGTNNNKAETLQLYENFIQSIASANKRLQLKNYAHEKQKCTQAPTIKLHG